MIFVTVGEQLPFDRLVKTIDVWARNSSKEVFAQIGATNYKPQNIEYKQFLNIKEFKAKIEDCAFIVAHAGMGSIISAIEYNKKILVMPRKKLLGEVRSNHQFSTCIKFKKMKNIIVAMDEEDLINKLDYIYTVRDSYKMSKNISTSKVLIENIQNFIDKTK